MKLRLKGGPGSGNFGHEGRPGQVGGSVGVYGGDEESKPWDTDPNYYDVEIDQDGPYVGQRGHFKEQTQTAIACFEVTDARLKALVDQDHPGESVKDLHITLLFIGDTSKVDKQWVIDQMRGFASIHAPIYGCYNGLAFFAPDEDGRVPFVMLYDSPELPAFRQALLHTISAEVDMKQNHGFTPHTTLYYVDGGQVFATTNSPLWPVAFGNLSLWWGDEHIDFPLVGTLVEKGGPGSGNYGHEGRPGQVGGSTPGSSWMPDEDDEPLAEDHGHPSGTITDFLMEGNHPKIQTFATVNDLPRTAFGTAYWITDTEAIVSTDVGQHRFHTQIIAGLMSHKPDYLGDDFTADEKSNMQRVLSYNSPENTIVEGVGLRKGWIKVRDKNGDVEIVTNEFTRSTLSKIKRLVDEEKIPLTTKRYEVAWYEGDQFYHWSGTSEELMTAKHVVRFPGSQFIELKSLPIDDASKANLLRIRYDIFNSEVDALAQKVFSGQISLGQWEEQMKATIKGLHASAGAIGKGGWEEMTQSDWGKVGAEVKKQYRYLHNFAETIAEKRDTISLKAIQARAHLYSESASHTANVIHAGDFVGTTRNPSPFALPWIPRDGTTECIMNCKCHWTLTVVDQSKTSKVVQAVWTLTPAEHCDTCIERNGYTVVLTVPKDTEIPSTIGGM